jgi:hypothetical protein
MKKAAHNSNTQVGVSCFNESAVLNQSSVHLMKLSAKNSHLRVASNRCGQYNENEILHIDHLSSDNSQLFTKRQRG